MSWKLAIGSTAKIQRNESINRYLGRMRTMATYVWKEFKNEIQKKNTNSAWTKKERIQIAAMAMNQSHEKLRHFVTGWKWWGEKMLSCRSLRRRCRLSCGFISIDCISFGSHFIRSLSNINHQNNLKHFQSDQSWSKCLPFLCETLWSEAFDSWFRAYEICPRCQKMNEDFLRESERESERKYRWRHIHRFEEFHIIRLEPCSSSGAHFWHFALHSVVRLKYTHTYTSFSFVLFPFALQKNTEKNRPPEMENEQVFLFLCWLLSFLCNISYALNITFT